MDICSVPPIIDELKKEAQQLGFWNLFLPHQLPNHLVSSNNNSIKISPSIYLSNREYGILCEVMGRSSLAPEACNCSAPDTGNMEVLLKHGTKEQQAQYLLPLLQGNIRSTFLMTEPDVASSDARNLETKLTKIVGSDGRVRYVLNGKKWWYGAMDPRCKVALVVCKMDYSHPSCAAELKAKQQRGHQTIVIVPMSHPGIKCVRALTVFGSDDAPHGHAEVSLNNIELDETTLSWHGSCREMIADSRSDLEAARLLTLACADDIDQLGAKGARDKIAMIKVAVPEYTSRVVDRAVQIFGGAGVSSDFPLARALVGLRTLRIADGPDAI
ncbi:acyl-CoA dehydrogenase [Skeletonema marinoi]|uniref:Acyl-CoA dehydrogenase n=1 Tax=Skeletonema marinoi TaxID=267567 RepID=A0AAD8Y0T1_9STRA|nr:acyl-CoA dehydrogenase [Skeletonema marinoi]